MRHRSVQSRAGSLAAAAALALAGFGVSAAHANFTLDLTLHNDGVTKGGTSTTVGTGSVVNLDVWGTVTGGGGNDGIQYAFFGVQNGGTSGNLGVVTLNGAFAGVANDAGSPVTTSQSGTLYGTPGSVSVGSATNDSTVADGWVFARATSMQQPYTDGQAVLLGTLQYTVSGTATAGSTATLTIIPRGTPNTSVNPALWQEGGNWRDTTNGTFAAGSAVTITVGSAPVVYPHAGDTDNSGKVDFADLTNLLNNYGQTNASITWGKGDFNHNHNVGFDDLTDLLNNYGQSFPTVPGWTDQDAPTGIALAAVPEPASLGLLGVGALGLAARRRSRR